MALVILGYQFFNQIMIHVAKLQLIFAIKNCVVLTLFCGKHITQ